MLFTLRLFRPDDLHALVKHANDPMCASTLRMPSRTPSPGLRVAGH